MDDIDYSNPESFFRALAASGSNLPIPKLLSSEEVDQKTRHYSQAILASLDTLHAVLERHETTIQNRWAKKNKQQRSKTLLNAWPSLPTSHRPDFEAFRRESERERKSGTRYRDAFMWPYLNLEDLTKPRPFLLMVKARGRNHPSYFASADREAMHLGHVTQAIVPTILNCYAVLLNRITDRNADHEYGKLISWDDHPDSFSWVMSQQQFHPGEALLVLEAQERLMSFLVDCCKQILHDIPSDQLTSNIYPIRPEPSLKSDVDVAGYASMAAMAAEAPYRLPISLDISRISSLLSAVAVDKEDHLWSLREDPGYFAQSVQDYADHRPEMVLDTLGKKHPIFKPQREDLFWHRVIGAVVSKSYLWLEVFSNLARQSRQLQELQMKHNSSISANQDLPPEYLDALLKFRYYLVQAADDLLDLLQHSVEASAPFRPFFVRTPPTSSSSNVNDVRPKGLKMDQVEENLYWLLKTLSENDNDLLLIRMKLALDELQRILDAESKASNMITEHISKVIGDLAVIGECLRQLDSYILGL